MTLTDINLLLLEVIIKNFNFDTFKMPLSFLSAIYNGEITLKEAEIRQKDLDKKIEELKFNYKSTNVKEEEEIN